MARMGCHGDGLVVVDDGVEFQWNSLAGRDIVPGMKHGGIISENENTIPARRETGKTRTPQMDTDKIGTCTGEMRL